MLNLVMREHPIDTAIDTGLRHVSVNQRIYDVLGTKTETVVSVEADSATVEAAYYFLRSIAEQVQGQHVEPTTAIYQSIRAFKSLLLGSSVGSTTSEIGLLGEILVLQELTDRGVVSFDRALRGWLGPHNEEHDFAFARCDIEVKATEKERRRHTISSATQLVETNGKNLIFGSVQLTRTSEGGHTLAEAIAALRDAIGDPELLEILRSRLQLAGVVPENEGNYTTRWTLRNPIEFYAVNDSFPRITTESYASMHERIDSVQYVINTDGIPTLSDDEVRSLIATTEEN
ncbi:PD-(D/E)XK motif protein [Corynebacterium sp. NPDC060344]|uniref:PD-(D/E)XK motif protein n=1 Tax=Corynebacterium sp. NPDC060344 TaxID=3347101 RepID=UPI0036485988